MESRTFRYVLAFMVFVLAGMAIRPYVEYRLFAATTPRPVDARGSLADYEKSSIELFEVVSPSVVHVVGRDATSELSLYAPDEGGIRTGTGFIWDPAGNVVTNDHVVDGTKMLAVRLASGEVIEATVMDRRWQYVLDCLDCPKAPFSKGTLVAFRRRLIAAEVDRRNKAAKRSL